VQANAGYANHSSAKPLHRGAPRSAREGELYDASFDATWELDFIRSRPPLRQAANAQVDSVEATRLDVLVSLTARSRGIISNCADCKTTRRRA